MPSNTPIVPKKDAAPAPAKHDANHRKDLPTPDHVASKENRAVTPNNETMADQPGTFQTLAPTGPTRSKVDNHTLSDEGRGATPAGAPSPSKVDKDTQSDQPASRPTKR